MASKKIPSTITASLPQAGPSRCICFIDLELSSLAFAALDQGSPAVQTAAVEQLQHAACKGCAGVPR